MTLPTSIALFPLSNGLFPDSVLRLNIFEVRYLDLIKKCEQNKSPFGVVFLEKGAEVQAAGQTPSFHRFGTLANLQTVDRVQPNLLQVVCLGATRFELISHELGAFGVWYASVRFLAEDEVVPIPAALQPVADKLGQIVAQAQQSGHADDLPFAPPYRLDECGWVANRIADLIPMPAIEKHEVLMQDNPLTRLEILASKIRF
jgi:uncharacterized protein